MCEQQDARCKALHRIAEAAREGLQKPTLELMDEVYRLLDLPVLENAEGLRIEGAISLPGGGSDGPLPLAVGGELRAEVPQDPCQDFAAMRFAIRATP